MIYFHDLLQNDGFRSFVQKRIASHPGNEGYAFPSSFPLCIATDLSRNMP